MRYPMQARGSAHIAEPAEQRMVESCNFVEQPEFEERIQPEGGSRAEASLIV